jgi:hypothetical protein
MFDHNGLLREFRSAAAKAGVNGWPCDLRTDRLPAPHRQPHLPPGWAGVYVFSLSERYGGATPAGAGRVLKVGKAGARSDPRFYSHHYNLSAPSTLARSLIKYRVLWPWLGISGIEASDVKEWMLRNLDRTHYFVPGGSDEVLAQLEVFVRACVGSVFEGAR